MLVATVLLVATILLVSINRSLLLFLVIFLLGWSGCFLVWSGCFLGWTGCFLGGSILGGCFLGGSCLCLFDFCHFINLQLN